VLRLVGAVLRHSDVVGLIRSELRELGSDLVEVEAGHLLVELLRKDVDTHGVVVLVLPEVDLGERLVGEAVRHHETRVTGGTSEVHEAAFGEDKDLVPTRERAR